MKTTLLAFILCLVGATAQAQEAANYQVTIDGKAMDVALGKEYKMKLANGREVTVAVRQKNVLTYQDDWISLQYPKGLHPAFATPDPDLEQMTLLTANGNGVLVQKYKTVDPTELVDLMVKEITNEEVSFGYSKTEEPFELKLVTGQKAVGKSVMLRYGSDVQRYTVAALGGKNEGIIFMTMLNTEQPSEDDTVVQMFLDTLAYKRK
ncbi:hypothetical protein [Pontibacter actiniarum]|uniref:DUF1795 domain-containing protein n=1 Tax=Pontibacter actiniarum TaxID=323450 RepID=A0A1X9YWD0_9BACT|nr:hypothetical protein [Pontibacter actiniarum]ARS37101.1 hypothetical protein CA264_17600 [Pontibacter actiniarum]